MIKGHNKKLPNLKKKEIVFSFFFLFEKFEIFFPYIYFKYLSGTSLRKSHLKVPLMASAEPGFICFISPKNKNKIKNE